MLHTYMILSPVLAAGIRIRRAMKEPTPDGLPERNYNLAVAVKNTRLYL